MNAGRDWQRSLRGAVALFALGMTGVLALAVYTTPSLRAIPELAALPFPLLLAVAAANSTVLLAVFVALGTATAPRVALQSHVYAWATRSAPGWEVFRESIRIAVGVGAALFFLTALLDVVFAPFVRAGAGGVVADPAPLRTLAASIPMRLLYGGITEELLLRWGVMAPIAWVLWRGRARLGGASDTPSDGAMWAAIVVSAVLFGVGHLPAVATTLGLTPALIVRTVVLNAVAGVGFGWLFWRRSLETAMVAHATFHVVLVGVSTALALLA